MPLKEGELVDLSSVAMAMVESDSIIVEKKKEKPRFQLFVNTADTNQWKQLRGIGPVYAKRICKYRHLLGGFARKEQLLEVYGVDSLLYQQILPFLVLQPEKIVSIDLNKATIAQLLRHPYLNYEQARSIVSYREQHGAYQRVEDVLKNVLIEPSDFRKFAPYLSVYDSPRDTVGH